VLVVLEVVVLDVVVVTVTLVCVYDDVVELVVDVLVVTYI
jgi:hypothetical protein